MTAAHHDGRAVFRRGLTGFVSLLGSSVISAAGFVAIASRRWEVMDAELAVFIILFVQWQTLGLTVAKTGIEQVVFATVSADPERYLEPRDYLLRRGVPLAVLCAAVAAWVFSPGAALVAFATIVLDTWSLIIMAELNARRRFGVTAVSNLLNYPLFFAVIFVIAPVRPPDRAFLLAVFLLSSVVRWLWMVRFRPATDGRQKISGSADLLMGGQQAFNYLMFRADQILLAVMGLKDSSPEAVGLYLFLAKFPELVSGVAVIAGTVYFPDWYLRHPFRRRELLGMAARGGVAVVVYVVAAAAALAGYAMLWQGGPYPRLLLVPFLVHAVFIMPANNITYSTLRQGYAATLLRNLILAVLAGAFLSGWMLYAPDLTAIAWIVPLQLTTFILASVLLGWGRQRVLV